MEGTFWSEAVKEIFSALVDLEEKDVQRCETPAELKKLLEQHNKKAAYFLGDGMSMQAHGVWVSLKDFLEKTEKVFGRCS